jgi:hypothetical protein
VNQNDVIANFPNDPAERLRFVLGLYADSVADRVVLSATFDRDKGQEIGLTFGDLRALADLIGA